MAPKPAAPASPAPAPAAPAAPSPAPAAPSPAPAEPAASAAPAEPAAPKATGGPEEGTWVVFLVRGCTGLRVGSVTTLGGSLKGDGALMSIDGAYDIAAQQWVATIDAKIKGEVDWLGLEAGDSVSVRMIGHFLPERIIGTLLKKGAPRPVGQLVLLRQG
ncbi:hypothetical protein [Roseospirillum parvum]|uniref:hypothetical protein n=1 Tax=Roseospirillum parvum TaxID=83401 RepID=UPI001160676D|nr:hypothetical protein [Roseospirillum parvum]